MSNVFGSLSEVQNFRFTDPCPPGQAILGFVGDSGGGIDNLGVRCGILKVREDRSSEPFTYSVAVTPGMEFPPVGGDAAATKGSIDALACGPDELVVSITMTVEPPGGSCPYNGCPDSTAGAGGCPTLYAMAIACTRFNITGSPGAFKVVRAGTPVMSAKVGSNGRASQDGIDQSFACPAAGMLGQVNGAFGGWPPQCKWTTVNGLQVVCTNPTIPMH